MKTKQDYRLSLENIEKKIQEIKSHAMFGLNSSEKTFIDLVDELIKDLK